MPIRRLTAVDRASAIDCARDMFEYLRSRGVDVPPFTLQMWQGWANTGHKNFAYVNAGGRVDAVCVYRQQDIVSPNNRRESWFCVPLLVVRPSVLATRAERETHMLRALKLVIPEASGAGAVGIMCEFDARWTDLHDWLAQWPTAEFDGEGVERCWLRFQPGLPAWTARTASIGG